MNTINPAAERVREGYANGVSAKKIGEGLGLTKNAIIGIANRLGLKHPNAPRRGVKTVMHRHRTRRPLRGFDDGGLVLADRGQTPPAHLCQYPRGNGLPDWDFCGAEIHADSSYCQDHHKLCYRRAEEKG